MRVESWLLSLMALVCLAAPLRAETVLFDFEADADVAAWHDERRESLGPGKALSRVERFATSGRCAMRFTTPAWKQGMPQWPSFEGAPPLTNWTGYDRLVFDVTNATGFTQALNLFITDSKVATRSGLVQQTRIPPFSYVPVVVPLTGLAEKKVNPADIRVMHFYTSEPAGDMEVFIDHIALLRPGETRPVPPAAYVREYSALRGHSVEAIRTSLAAARAWVKEHAAKMPGAAAFAERDLADLDRRVEAFAATLARGDASVLDESGLVAQLPGEVARLQSLVAFAGEFEAVRPQVRAGVSGGDGMAAGFATSMEKVLPRAVPLQVKTSARVDLSLARNEKESFQVVVVPLERDVKGVSVRAVGLRGPGGAALPPESIQAVPVGYVQTQSRPPYGSSHVGWWPDPILNFLPAADIARGDAQSFWVRVHAPKDQAPGTYSGKLEVLTGGARAFSFDLSVRVYPFRLPERSPLPLAITFSPHDSPTAVSKPVQAEWAQSPDYPINAWKKHRLEWADFLADYYITFDSLYHKTSPDFEAIERLHKQGRLDRFNLGYYGPVGDAPADAEKWKAEALPRLRAAYEQAKKLGVLDHAYIYGCDECPADQFIRVERAAAILKAEFPDVLIMTTTYDHSYGQESVIKSMDAWCPLTPRFDLAKASKARAAGKEVWWYICCSPHHPNANMFVEYPAIEGRILMGAITTRCRPDGFLYYQISIWNSQRPIESGPFTTWDPRSWTTYHGDGSWTCVGPGGTPIPTIRLENFRDGLEDYAYARILEATVRKVEASPALAAGRAAWLANAKKLLAVPEDVVKTPTQYTTDPAALYRWRDALAEAIVAAGVDAPEL